MYAGHQNGQVEATKQPYISIVLASGRESVQQLMTMSKFLLFLGQSFTFSLNRFAISCKR